MKDHVNSPDLDSFTYNVTELSLADFLVDYNQYPEFRQLVLAGGGMK